MFAGVNYANADSFRSFLFGLSLIFCAGMAAGFWMSANKARAACQDHCIPFAVERPIPCECMK